MTKTARQLVLELSHRPALGRDDFLVTPSNAAAVAMIDQWPAWPAPAVLLAGPTGSGKSHLVEVWRQRSGATRIEADYLRGDDVPDLIAGGAVVVENAPGEALDETALFHLLNHGRDEGATLLLTAAHHPGLWRVKLPDLLSRLNALPVAELGPPDDALLRGLLVKLFADRQLAIDEPVISYLIARMPRSAGAARALVAEIDRQALENKIEISRSFVAKVLGGLNAPDLFADEG